MSEVRRDIVTDTWVIIDTDETQIPVIPRVERSGDGQSCPFDEGNESQTPPEIMAIRNSGTPADGPGWKVRVVPNIKPILRIEGELQKFGIGVYDMVTGIGANEVIIETPRHVENIFELPQEDIQLVLRTYRTRIIDLHKDKRMRYILIFKNYGRQAGSSTITHTHSDLIALPATPMHIKLKLKGTFEYYSYKERCLLCDIIQQEVEFGDRLIFQSDLFAVLAPYASRFPFEILILPKNHSFSYKQISDDECMDLAYVLKKIFRSIDRTIGIPPYNLILNDSPNLLPRSDYWTTIEQDYHWHIEIIPRIHRTTGFELGTGFYINRLAPERVAAMLRANL